MATCKCVNGHIWHARILEDDHSINSFVIEPDVCPECGAVDPEILEVDTSDPFLD